MSAKKTDEAQRLREALRYKAPADAQTAAGFGNDIMKVIGITV